MGVFSRMNDIINSNINAMLDKAENPEKVVRLVIQEMEDTLVEVRSTAARQIADRKDLERREARTRQESGEWERRAELAVSKGRDDLAKAALAERRRMDQILATLRHEHEEVELALAKLDEDIAALKAKLDDAKSRQKALLMRQQTASSRLKARSRTHDARINDALGRFEHFEHKLEAMEGRVEAYDLGRERNLEREFADLEGDDAVSAELASLKARMAATNKGDAA